MVVKERKASGEERPDLHKVTQFLEEAFPISISLGATFRPITAALALPKEKIVDYNQKLCRIYFNGELFGWTLQGKETALKVLQADADSLFFKKNFDVEFEFCARKGENAIDVRKKGNF
ncbi:Uncharacterised protein [uncultured archaeon]|nr:Uncharacterised protein [uncultured archaeon]